MRRTTSRGIVFAICIASVIPFLHGAPRALLDVAAPYMPNCEATDLACQAWASFRIAHPYPYQAIQWKPLSNGLAAVMLLEPPPDIPKPQLERLVRTAFGSDLRSFQRYRWRMGIDGWLEDTVLTIPATSSNVLDDPLLRDRVAFLYVALFGTAWGATFDKPAAGLPESAPNLIMNPGEIRRWVTDPALRWRQLNDENAAPVTWQILANRRRPGAFIASDRSLVILAFPREMLSDARLDSDRVNSLRVPFRCFALATDALAGAFRSSNGLLAVVGRPRSQSVAAVPPLRFETFRLLASQTGDELAQSYERRSLFAGKLSTGPYVLRDWAPIYLSDALIDTEFGALLNTTDQLLKSWSEAGTVEYLHFNYPKPPAFPFSTSLSARVEKETGSGRVLFNWNTAGSAVSLLNTAGVSLAPRQTGALPVTYGAGPNEIQTDSLMRDEETAYRYFAGRKDPNLARVVQYTLLYQFFRNASPSTAGSRALSRSEHTPPGQESAVRARRSAAAIRVRLAAQLISDIDAGRARLRTDEQDQIASLLSRFRAANPGMSSSIQIAAVVADRFSDESKKLDDKRRAVFERRLNELDAQIDAYNRKLTQARFGVTPRIDLDLERQSIEKEKAALRRFQSDDPVRDLRNLMVNVARRRPEMEQVRQGFVHSFDYEPAGSIKTPSIVISWNPTDLDAVGGHNIRARTLKMEPNASEPGISVKMTDDGPVLRYNPAKASMVEAHATELARAVEHRGVQSTAELEKIIAPAVPARTRTVALDLHQSVRAPDSWEARLGSRVISSKSEFTGRLRGLAETNACCEFIGYDKEGIAFAADRNLSPPPSVVTFELRDTLSLTDHVNAASKRGRPVIFLDTPEAHVEALGLESAIGERMAPDLNGMAEWLGRRPVVDGGGTVDGIAGKGLHGEPGFLRTLVGKAEESSLALLKRLTALRPAESWASATVRKLGSSEIGDMMRGIEWNERTDGLPTAIMLRFDPAATQGSLDVSIVAGFAERDFSAGRGALEAIHDKNFKLAQAKREALYRYALSVKSELEKMPDLRTKRFTVVVKQKKTRQLLSVLEPMPVLLYAPPHA